MACKARNRTTTTRPIAMTSALLVLTAGLTVGLAAGNAQGQNNLGDGTALDRSLRVNGPRTNAARNDLAADLRFRNAIVTGNAPGGLSFRGDVGYVGARDFRGELGSDETFEFRRDSLYSGLSGLGLRGTESLQFQIGTTTGNSVQSSLLGSLSLERGTNVLTARNVGVQTPTQNLPGVNTNIKNANQALNTDIEELGNGLWKLRSTSGFLTDRTLLPSYIGGTQSTSGVQTDLFASSLTGVTAQRNDTAARTAEKAQKRRAPTAHDRLVESLRADMRIETQPPTQPVTQPAGANQAPQSRAIVNDSFSQMQNRLRAFLAETDTSFETDTSQSNETDFGFGQTRRRTTNADEGPDAVERLADQIESLGGDAEALRRLRSSGQPAQTFSDAPPEGTDFYAIHMSAGEGLLAAKRYFDAEARFTLALSVAPSDPTASIARVHASMGAGLIRTPAVNLRTAFMANPELLGAAFDASLLPPKERIVQLKSLYRERMEREGASARAAALLLAYVGFQTGDTDSIASGLDRLEREGPDRLVQLARLVWLDTEEPTEEPTKEQEDTTPAQEATDDIDPETPPR